MQILKTHCPFLFVFQALEFILREQSYIKRRKSGSVFGSALFLFIAVSAWDSLLTQWIYGTSSMFPGAAQCCPARQRSLWSRLQAAGATMAASRPASRSPRDIANVMQRLQGKGDKCQGHFFFQYALKFKHQLNSQSSLACIFIQFYEMTEK